MLKLILFLVIYLSTVELVILENSDKNSTDNTQNEFVDDVGKFTKRLLWMNKRRKFILPTGTILTLSPKITVPVFRGKPFNGGLNSDIQASWFLYMYFDKLGMTSDDHIWPIRMPPFYPFGELMAGGPFKKSDETQKEEGDEKGKLDHIRNAAHAFNTIRNTHYNNNYNNYRNGGVKHRNERSILSLPPPESCGGGERAVILPRLESMFENIGMEGRKCMLRAICEIHEYPLEKGYGFFGEIVTLFFSISKSKYAESHMPEYLKAEQAGKSGDCNPYFKDCKKSIFHFEDIQDTQSENEIFSKEDFKETNSHYSSFLR